MDLNQSTKFLVVAFKDYTLTNGKRTVKLVPKSWIHQIGDEKWFCAYPPEEDYVFIGDWVKDEKVPDEKWIQYEIEIVKQASKYIYKNKKIKRENEM